MVLISVIACGKSVNYASGDGRDCAEFMDHESLEVTALPPAGEACTGSFADCASKCEAGEAWSCSTAARRALNGDGVQRNLKKALELARRACILGHPDGCIMAGEQLLRVGQRVADNSGGPDSQVVRKTTCGALFAFTDGCTLGSFEACELGLSIPNDSFSVDDTLAQHRLRMAVDQACTRQRRADACLWCTVRALSTSPEGTLYFAVPDDQLCYRRACELGDDLGCVGYALSKALKAKYAQTHNATPYVEAHAEMQQLCDGGNGIACDYMPEMDKLRALGERRQAEHQAALEESIANQDGLSKLAMDTEMAWRQQDREAQAARREHARRAYQQAMRNSAWYRSGTSSSSTPATSCAGGYYASKEVNGYLHSSYVCP